MVYHNAHTHIPYPGSARHRSILRYPYTKRAPTIGLQSITRCELALLQQFGIASSSSMPWMVASTAAAATVASPSSDAEIAGSAKHASLHTRALHRPQSPNDVAPSLVCNVPCDDFAVPPGISTHDAASSASATGGDSSRSQACHEASSEASANLLALRQPMVPLVIPLGPKPPSGIDNRGAMPVPIQVHWCFINPSQLAEVAGGGTQPGATCQTILASDQQHSSA